MHRHGHTVNETNMYICLWVMHLSAVAGYLTSLWLKRRLRTRKGRWPAGHPVLAGWMVFLLLLLAGVAAQVGSVRRGASPAITASSTRP